MLLLAASSILLHINHVHPANIINDIFLSSSMNYYNKLNTVMSYIPFLLLPAASVVPVLSLTALDFYEPDMIRSDH